MKQYDRCRRRWSWLIVTVAVRIVQTGQLPAYRLDIQGVVVAFPAGQEISLFPRMSRPTMGPTVPSHQWVLRALST
jgi:hypothetical protein